MTLTSYGPVSCSTSFLSNTQSRIASLAIWWPSDCDTPRKPSTDRDDRFSGFLMLLARSGFDTIGDQADRALGLDRDALGERKQAANFVDQLLKLRVATEDDVLLLEVRGELHRDDRVNTGVADVVVAALRPRVMAAPDRAMADMDHVLHRAPHHALRSGVGAATDGHDARNRLDVRLDDAFSHRTF